MFFALQSDQEAKEQREENLEAFRRHELQKFIGHRFFSAGGPGVRCALTIVRRATYCHRETIGIFNYTDPVEKMR